MKIKVTILEGCYATLEKATPEEVVAYMKLQPTVATWEITGTPEEEQKVLALLKTA